MKSKFNNDTIDNINKIIKWYGGLPRDYNDVKELIHKRSKLIAHYHTFTSFQNETAQNKNRSEVEYEAKLAHLKNKYIARPFTEQNVLSKHESLDEHESAINKKALLQNVNLRINGIKEVLNSMNQHVSLLKDDRSRSIINN